MKSFTDTAGNAWDVVINVGQVRRVKARLDGLDLYRLADDRLRPLGELLADPCRLCDVLYVLCEEQCAKKGVNDEQFGRGLGGDVLAAAADAFVEELIDFFPDRNGREELRRVRKKGREVAERMLAKGRDLVDGMDAEALAERLVAPARKRLAELTSGGSSGNSPASSASTPGPSPSAS